MEGYAGVYIGACQSMLVLEVRLFGAGVMVTVSHMLCMLRTELVSSGTETRAFSHGTTSPDPTSRNFNVYFSDA